MHCIRVEHVCSDVSVANSKIVIRVHHILVSTMHTGRELNAKKSGDMSSGQRQIMMDTQEDDVFARNIR